MKDLRLQVNPPYFRMVWARLWLEGARERTPGSAADWTAAGRVTAQNFQDETAAGDLDNGDYKYIREERIYF